MKASQLPSKRYSTDSTLGNWKTVERPVAGTDPPPPTGPGPRTRDEPGPGHHTGRVGSRSGPAWVVVLALVACCCAGSAGQGRELAGERVEVLAVWEDSEAARFRVVLDRFEAVTGADVAYTSTAGDDISTVLDARLAAGRAPDVALVPLPSLITRYARAGHLRPLDELVGDRVAAEYAPVWRDLGSVDGTLYGVWVKAAHKSLVWYRLAVFERAGVVPPATLEGFEQLARSLSAAGVPAFALGGADGWTVTDWFENLYLRLAGTERYDALAQRRLPWTDPTVTRTLSLMARLLAPEHLAGGPDGAAATTLPEAVSLVFDPSPAAAMVAGGDFVAGFITATTASELGVDADAFLFPEPGGGGRSVVGGGDAAVVLQRSAAAESLLRFLASPEAGEVWASLGGFLSPNDAVDLAAYPDERTRSIARSLLEAGDSFRFDLSDQQPARFGGTDGLSMGAILREFLRHPDDPAATAAMLEAAAGGLTG